MDIPSTSTGRTHRYRYYRTRREIMDEERPRGSRFYQPPRHRRLPAAPPLPMTLKERYWPPDSIHWPVLTELETKRLGAVLNKYRVKRANYHESTWRTFNKVEKVLMRPTFIPPSTNAFLYGLADCCAAVLKRQCWAVIVEARVTPRSIVLPIIDGCMSNNIPMVCMNKLRNINVYNFGMYSGCLGIRKGYLPELRNEISEISKAYRATQLKLRYYQQPQPVVREPCEIIVEELFDLNPVDHSHNVVLPAMEAARANREPAVDAPSTSRATPGASRDALPPFNIFRMVLKKSSRHHRDRAAWLDIDNKTVILMPE